jgi:hypothetical protein
MGWESVLFVAGPSQLAAFFPGWKPALAAPTTRTVVNPFTKEAMTHLIETAEYEKDDEYSAGCDWNRFREAAPPAINQEISRGILAKLARLLNVEEPIFRRALSEPPDSETTVLALVPEFVEALGRIRDDLDEELPKSLRTLLVDLARKARETQGRIYLVEER